MRVRRVVSVVLAIVVSGALGTSVPVAAAPDALELQGRSTAKIVGTPKDLLGTIPAVAPLAVGYKSGMFLPPNALTKRNKRGCTLRNELLIKMAVKKPKVIGRQCALRGGEWLVDFGTKRLRKASQVKLGKLLPDKSVYAQGAFGWTPAQRSAYSRTVVAPKPATRSLPSASESWLNQFQPMSNPNLRWLNAINNTIANIIAIGGTSANPDAVLTEERPLTGPEAELEALKRQNPTLFTSWTVATLMNAKSWGISLSPIVKASFEVTIAECSASGEKGNVCDTELTFPSEASRYGITVVPTLASTTPEVTSEPLRGYGAPTGPVIDRHLFGLHAPADWVSDIESGFEGPTNPRTIPNVPVGYLRLWDTETTWRDIQPSPEQFDWRKLERQIQTAQVLDSKVMYVLGGTPAWAGDGSVTSPPTNIDEWRAYVNAVACRFPNSIHSYEIWNEANLQTFWTGSPAQMADLTAAAFQEIRACSPNALVVAASTTTRATGSFATFFPAYLEELKKRNWPADAYSVHTYPTASGNSAARIQGIGQFRTFLALAGAPFTTVFDTEVNYGLAGLLEDKRNIGGTDAMTLLSRTYIDSARYGFGSTFWYVWTANPDSKFGIQFTPDTGNEQAAWRTTYDWLVGSQYQRCFDTDQKLTVCQFNKGGDNFSIVWRGDVGSTPATMPTGYLTGFGSRSCDLFGNCDVMTNDTRLTVGPMPIRIDGAPIAGGGASTAPQPQTPSGEKLAAPTVTDIELIYGAQNKIDAVASWLPPQNATLWRLDRYEYELQYCDGPCKTVNRGSAAPNTTSVRITLPNGPGKYQFVVRATATGFVTSGDGSLSITAISQVQSPQSQKAFTALTTRAAPPSDVVLSVLKDQGKIEWRRPGIKADLVANYQVQIRNITKDGRWKGGQASAGSSQRNFSASQLDIEIGDTIVARVRTVLKSGLKSPFVTSNQQTVNEQVEAAGMFSAIGEAKELIILPSLLDGSGGVRVISTCPFPANAVQIRFSSDGVNWTLARYRPGPSTQISDSQAPPLAGTGDSFIPLCGVSVVSPPDGLEWNSKTRFEIRHTNNSGKLPSDWTPFSASFPPAR